MTAQLRTRRRRALVILSICIAIILITFAIGLYPPAGPQPSNVSSEGQPTELPAQEPNTSATSLDLSNGTAQTDEPETEPKFQADDSEATPESTAAVVNATNQFAFELYSEYKSDEGNVFFSPYSISTALAMTYEGARGETAKEMEDVLHFSADAAVRRPSFASLYNRMNKGGAGYNLSTANALWVQESYKLLEEFTGAAERFYGARATNLNLAGDSEGSRLTINEWVENQTRERITNLIPAGVINRDTRLVLTNAVYFKGAWLTPFDKKDTTEHEFTKSSGEIVRVQMMRFFEKNILFNYTEAEDVQVLELPYEGGDLSMLIILPKAGSLESVENELTITKLNEWKKSFGERLVNVYLPKFKFEAKYFMAETLMKMGMPSAFVAADFTGMARDTELYISSVIHQAFVEVNEEGTEAAAATAVIVSKEGMAPPEFAEFRADRPFIFILQEKGTGTILFLGRMSDPTA